MQTMFVDLKKKTVNNLFLYQENDEWKTSVNFSDCIPC